MQENRVPIIILRQAQHEVRRGRRGYSAAMAVGSTNFSRIVTNSSAAVG